MKTGDKVETPYGTGEILTEEFNTDRYLVKMDNCPSRLLQTHIDNGGGLYFWKNELEVLE